MSFRKASTPGNQVKLQYFSQCILIMSFISPFEIISVVVLLFCLCLPNPKIFLCILVSAADAAAVNPKGIKTLLAEVLITFFYYW